MTRCFRCRSTVTNLSIAHAISQFFANRPKAVAYELSTYGSTLRWLRSHFNLVLTSEFFPDRSPGQVVDGVRNEDVERLSFSDNSIDVITSNQVFEHVPNDVRGFAQCWRVLKTGGALFFSVPLFSIPTTRMWARLEGSTVKFLGVPEYHDSRLGGVASAPVFWHHSEVDIEDRVKSVGFSSVSLIDVMITPVQEKSSRVICAVK